LVAEHAPQVEVEVQKNAFLDEETTMTSTFRGERGQVKSSAKEYLHRLQHAPHEAEKEVEHVRENVKQGVHEAEDKAMHKMEDIARTISPTHHTQAASQHPESGDEEGWASDNDPHNGEPGPSTSEAPATSRSPDRKGKSSKQKGALFAAGSRRRPRMRRRGSSSQTQSPQLDAAAEDDDEGEGEARRGRTHGAKTPAAMRLQPVADDDRRGSLRSPRLEQLRSADARRASSPARSVRFADDDELSEPRTTPYWRTPLDTPSPGTPRTTTPPPGEDQGQGGEGDANRRNVSFDLPHIVKP
jgi:hypothetical protein